MIGLFNDLCQVYEQNIGLDGAENLLIGHGIANIHLVVNLTSDGELVNISLGGKNQQELIPMTVKSIVGRSNGIVPHGLHENLQYVSAGQKGYDQYIEQLTCNAEGNEFFTAVLNYLKQRTLRQDLISHGFIDENETPKGGLENICIKDGNTPKSMNSMVSWTVDGLSYGKKERQHWCNLFLASEADGDIHPTAWGKAKLYSSPTDNNMLTTKGTIFGTNNATLEIETKVIHRAYTTLKWLISRQSSRYSGDTCIIAFKNNGDAVVDLMDDYGPSEVDVGQVESVAIGRRVFGSNTHIDPNETIKILVMKKSGDYRCSVIRYETMKGSNLINILDAYTNRCWDNKGNKRSTPGLKRLKTAVLGNRDSDGCIGHIANAQLNAVLKGANYPLYMERHAIKNSLNPNIRKLRENKKDAWRFWDTIMATKAIARHNHQEVLMNLEQDKNFVAGRALNILHSIEHSVLKDRGQTRETNAERNLSTAHTKPVTAVLNTHKKVTAYLNGQIPLWAKKELGKLLPVLGTTDFTVNAVFLIGYYHFAKTEDAIQEVETEEK